MFEKNTSLKDIVIHKNNISEVVKILQKGDIFYSGKLYIDLYDISIPDLNNLLYHC